MTTLLIMYIYIRAGISLVSNSSQISCFYTDYFFLDMVADLILINQNQIKHIHLNFFYKIHTKVFHNLSNWITLLVFEILGKFYVVIPFLLTNKVLYYWLSMLIGVYIPWIKSIISKYNMCSLLYIIILCIQTVHWSCISHFVFLNLNLKCYSSFTFKV